MTVPFGFSVGDFLVVGKLIRQVIVELRENGEAAPEYQSLVVELEALERALRKLHTLRPAKHELFQLVSIQATALACHRPLRDFLDKISKYEDRLGAVSAGRNKWKGLPRRMQFRVLFKDDVHKLPENDRERLASRLENRILGQRRLLEVVESNTERCLDEQREIQNALQGQTLALEELGRKECAVHDQLRGQEAVIRRIDTIVDQSQLCSKSILAAVTETLALVASGLLQLRQISQKLQELYHVCTSFTAEMRDCMKSIAGLFFMLQSISQRLDSHPNMRLYLPIVKFTTILGDQMAMPLQILQDSVVFKDIVRILFREKRIGYLVDAGYYEFLKYNTQDNKFALAFRGEHKVLQNDELTMVLAIKGFCWTTLDQCPSTRSIFAAAPVLVGTRCHYCDHCEGFYVLFDKGYRPVKDGRVEKKILYLPHKGGQNELIFGEMKQVLLKVLDLEQNWGRNTDRNWVSCWTPGGLLYALGARAFYELSLGRYQNDQAVS